MKESLLRWKRQAQIAWLAALIVPIAAEAAQRRSRTADLSVSIVGIGGAKVSGKTKAETQRSSTTYYYVHQGESLAIWLSSPLPPRAKLYPLVRKERTTAWTVQPAAVGPGGRNEKGEWKAEARFGGQADLGVRFELMVVAAAEPLPPTPLPEGMRMASTLAESATVWVERRKGRPSIGIAAIEGVPVTGEEEIMVHDESRVEVVAHDLPAESQVGVAVEPVGTGLRWVMPGASGNGTGEITGYFGRGDGTEQSFHYTVSGFVASDDALPPSGRPISSLEWKRYQAAFLAESRGVRVVRWERELKIEAIGGVPTLTGAIRIRDGQVDVQGAAKEKLLGKRIWIVCLPSQGDPWLAGWTTRLRPSGRWSVNAAQLFQDGKPADFDVVAVVSADDATRIRPASLRTWLYGVQRPFLSTKVWVEVSGVAEAGARPAGKTRP